MAPQVIRYDRGELVRSVRRQDGSLLVEAFVARPGVYEYRTGNGKIRREYIPAEELAKLDSLATLGRVPVTNEHHGMITPDNVQQHGVGDLDGDVQVIDNGFVRVKMAVRRRDALDAVNSGKVEVSPGYTCHTDETPGVHPVFGPYDAIQRGRRYNHVAITERGRGGPSIHLRADDAEQIIEDQPMHPFKAILDRLDAAIKAAEAREDAAEKRIDASDMRKVFDEMTEELRKAKADMDKLLGERDGAKADADKKADEYEALKADFEKFKADMEAAKTAAEPKQDSAERIAWFAERVKLLDMAQAEGIEKADSLDNAALARAIVAKVIPEVREDASDDYISGALALWRTRADSTQKWHGEEPPPKVVEDSAPDRDPYATQQRAAFAAAKTPNAQAGSGK